MSSEFPIITLLEKLALGMCVFLVLLLACTPKHRFANMIGSIKADWNETISPYRRVLKVYICLMIALALLGQGAPFVAEFLGVPVLTTFGENCKFFSMLSVFGLLGILYFAGQAREQQRIRSGIQALFTPRVGPPPNNIAIINSNMVVKNKTTTTTTGDIISSNIGSIGSARDSSVVVHEIDSSHLNVTEKEALKKANDELDLLSLNSRSKDDVRECLLKVAQEIQQQQPDEGRLKHLLKTIKDIAAPVASALSIASSLAKLLR